MNDAWGRGILGILDLILVKGVDHPGPGIITGIEKAIGHDESLRVSESLSRTTRRSANRFDSGMKLLHDEKP